MTDLVTFLCREFNVRPDQLNIYLHGTDFSRNAENYLKQFILKTSPRLSIHARNRLVKVGGLSPLSATCEKAYPGSCSLTLSAYNRLKHKINLKYPHVGIFYGFITEDNLPVIYPLELIHVCK